MPPTALILSQLFNGLAEGLLLALIATGLTVIYGTLGVINFAHGALFVVGAYVGLVVFNATGSFVLAIAAGAAVTLLLGLVMERGIVRLYYDRPPEDQLLVTFGIGIVLVEAIRAGFGGIALTVPQPHWGEGVANLGFLIYPLYRLQILAISAATLAVLYVVLYRTRLGLIVRTGIEDAQMVDVLGINVKREGPVGEVWFRGSDHQGIVNFPIVRGKKPADMKNKEDFYDVVEIVPGEGLMQKPDAFGCNLGSYT